MFISIFDINFLCGDVARLFTWLKNVINHLSQEFQLSFQAFLKFVFKVAIPIRWILSILIIVLHISNQISGAQALKINRLEQF